LALLPLYPTFLLFYKPLLISVRTLDYQGIIYDADSKVAKATGMFSLTNPGHSVSPSVKITL
jgi:hypothetical protein